MTRGSGNVFADLGLPNPEQRLVKAGLVLQVHRAIEAMGVTKAEVARLTGIPQPKVSDLLAGRSQGFSIDRLMRILNNLGQDVEIVVRPKPSEETRPAHVMVVA
ncbi:helix-turn-helix transcriptional regulator [soil metagenome]